MPDSKCIIRGNICNLYIQSIEGTKTTSMEDVSTGVLEK